MTTTRSLLDELKQLAGKKAVAESKQEFNRPDVREQELAQKAAEAARDNAQEAATAARYRDLLIEEDQIRKSRRSVATEAYPEEEFDGIGGFTAAERMFIDGYEFGTSKADSFTRAPKRRRHG